MKSKHLMIALAGMAFISPAQAENLNNWYISGAVGLTKKPMMLALKMQG